MRTKADTDATRHVGRHAPVDLDGALHSLSTPRWAQAPEFQPERAELQTAEGTRRAFDVDVRLSTVRRLRHQGNIELVLTRAEGAPHLNHVLGAPSSQTNRISRRHRLGRASPARRCSRTGHL